MSNRPDPWLDQQLRQVPLPPGLLARLKAAGELTDEDLDEELRQVAIPDDLLGQLLAIPADAEVERRLAEVPVPSHLVDELSAIPIDERIRDVPMPRDLMVSLRKIAPRRQTGTSAKFQRMLATAIKRARHMALLPYRRD